MWGWAGCFWWQQFWSRGGCRRRTFYLAAFWLVTLARPAIAGGYPVPLVSPSRYVLVLFPVFMAGAQLGRDRFWNDSYLVLSTGLLAILTAQFVNGGWIV